MTTIAYKDGVMVSDTQGTAWGHYITGPYTKIFKHNDYIVGCSGDLSVFKFMDRLLLEHEIKKLLDTKYLKENKLLKIMKKLHNNNYLMIVNNKKEIFSLQEYGFIKISSKYWSIGSGKEIALTAMYLGKSAKESVKIASKLDCFTNSKVIEVKI